MAEPIDGYGQWPFLFQVIAGLGAFVAGALAWFWRRKPERQPEIPEGVQWFMDSPIVKALESLQRTEDGIRRIEASMKRIEQNTSLSVEQGRRAVEEHERTHRILREMLEELARRHGPRND